MIDRGLAGLVVRLGAIVALVALGLAMGLIGWQEHLTGSASDPAALAADRSHLRLALVLLSVGVAAVVLMAVLVARALPATSERPAALEQAGADDSAERMAVDLASASTLPVPLARAGHLVSVGALIRAFCHELNNQLGPIQGYAELLCEDPRLSELHRRQVARIRDATRIALGSIGSFGAALGWSNDPAHITRLGGTTAEAARSAQAALSARVEVEIAAGAEVEVTATEVEVGQAILHLFAAAMPLLARHDGEIRIRVDSVVGGSSATEVDSAVSAHRLEIWSDPIDPQRTKVQFGTLRPSWRYGRVRLDFNGGGWHRDQVGRMFDPPPSDEAASEVASMALLGTLMIETGGVIVMDTCPGKQTTATLLWPTRIAPEVGAPLELDANEDELDALIIHATEATAEDLSRRLIGLGLRVASTTSTDVAADLIAEMGSRCHAVVLAQSSGGEFASRIPDGRAQLRVFQFEAVPDEQELRALAAKLRPAERAT